MASILGDPGPRRDRARRPSPALLAVLGASLAGVLLWSALGPRDRLTWVLEASPVMVALPLLALLYRRFAFTPLVYTLIWLHALVLLVGAHYTYAEVPAFEWLERLLGLSRNPYDRLGHIVQGVVPAMIAREVLIRWSPLERGGWLFLIVTSVCLAISALYEILEWWIALIEGSAAAAFLATQGDPWDTQWDMALALGGAVVSQLSLGRWHDRQLGRA
ncbi:MAG: DUF2238 domain-containing protein [Gammaproteobacteria bacterium]|nr:DUF2238 domain-containing protein [Gammaproteobacteria bacterium]